MYDVLKYINENLQNKLTLEETAERFAYSKWYFCEAFKKFAGITFTDYVRHRRMQLAASEVMAGKRFTENLKRTSNIIENNMRREEKCIRFQTDAKYLSE